MYEDIQVPLDFMELRPKLEINEEAQEKNWQTLRMRSSSKRGKA
jgi:hypothetical protein